MSEINAYDGDRRLEKWEATEGSTNGPGYSIS